MGYSINPSTMKEGKRWESRLLNYWWGNRSFNSRYGRHQVIPQLPGAGDDKVKNSIKEVEVEVDPPIN